MKRITILICVFVSVAGLINLRGQSIGPCALNAMGNSGAIGSNEFEWSIGEMTMVSTFTSSTIVVTQGVLQPGSSTTGIAVTLLADNLQVFPNPSSSIVYIQFNSKKDGMLNYRLMDISGRLISEKSSTIIQGSNTQQFDMSDIAPAIYMLHISFIAGDTAVENTSYKIEKFGK